MWIVRISSESALLPFSWPSLISRTIDELLCFCIVLHIIDDFYRGFSFVVEVATKQMYGQNTVFRDYDLPI